MCVCGARDLTDNRDYFSPRVACTCRVDLEWHVGTTSPLANSPARATHATAFVSDEDCEQLSTSIYMRGEASWGVLFNAGCSIGSVCAINGA